MANALALYTAPEGGLREDVQTYADDQMLPYLNQRPSLAEQSANYWLPQFAALLGPGPRQTLDKGWTPPNAEQVFADPLMNMLQPGNIGMAGMLVGKGSKLWKSAPQVGKMTRDEFIAQNSMIPAIKDPQTGRMVIGKRGETHAEILNNLLESEPKLEWDWIDSGWVKDGKWHTYEEAKKIHGAEDSQSTWDTLNRIYTEGGPPETVPQGAFSNLYDKKPMLEVSDAGAKWKNPRADVEDTWQIFSENNRRTGEPVTLGSLMEHEKLFQAEPRVKDLNVEFHSGSGASFNESTNTITLPRGKTNEELMKITLHEIEHPIQGWEGWARGGSPQGPYYPEVRNQIINENAEQRYSAWQKAGLDDSFEEAKRMATEWADSPAGREYAYRRLFGEYMARDTASRNALTEAQRMNTMPFSSEPEMTPDKMIYRYGGNALQAHTAYHGSPHKWTKVDLSKAGTGEGAAAYGHGFYATDLKDIADYYKSKLSGNKFNALSDSENSILDRRTFDTIHNVGEQGLNQEIGFLKTDIKELEKTVSDPSLPSLWSYKNQLDDAKSKLKSLEKLKKSGDVSQSAKGHLYKLDIPGHENLLDWDKPLSEQPEKVRESLSELADGFERVMGVPKDKMTGQALYDFAGSWAEWNKKSTGKLKDEVASNYFRSIGIPGHKYLDQGSRTGKSVYQNQETGKWFAEGTARAFDSKALAEKEANKSRSFNYVIYDPEAVNVLEMSRNNPELFRSNVA
jgi:hypothetical protein